jgi:crotonobetainyl-CoA:carnitine CoA-transferase CaiB-like acyl-CoA transferase
MPAALPGALDGVVVADFSRVLAGPYATMLLGDLGAEVIKVERPGTGDDTRAWGPPWAPTGPEGADEATYFLGVNRNKRSVTLDLRNDAGRAEALALAQRADVVIENFKPGAFEAMGLGYDAVSAVNSAVIYCSISGFGEGAGADLPGYDLLVQAAGGLMSVTGPAPGEPTKVGVALVDVVTGLHATVGILAALQHRATTGEGQRVTVNLLSSLLSALVNQSSAYVAGGVVPAIMGNQHPSIAPYETFPTADKDVVLAVGNDGQFRRLVDLLGCGDLADDERFATNPARVQHRDELRALLIPALATRGADEWFTTLMAAGVPCGPINGIDEAVALAASLDLAPVVEVEGVPTIAHPIGFSRTPASYRRRPPVLDGEA